MAPKIIHVITVIDGSSEEVVDVFRIPGFELSSFRVQFGVPIESDPEMLDRYAIGPDDLPFLWKALNDTPEFNFSQNAYFIEAVEDDS